MAFLGCGVRERVGFRIGLSPGEWSSCQWDNDINTRLGSLNPCGFSWPSLRPPAVAVQGERLPDRDVVLDNLITPATPGRGAVMGSYVYISSVIACVFKTLHLFSYCMYEWEGTDHTRD